MNGIDEQLLRIEAIANTAEYAAAYKQREAEQLADIHRSQRELVKRIGLPEKDRIHFHAQTPRETTALAHSRDVDGLLVLSGQAGCGKTVAASWWLWRFVMEVGNWRWTDFGPKFLFRAPLFATATRLTRWPRFDAGRMTQLHEASRLVVDDLGAEYMDEKGAFMAFLDELVNERYANRRPTIFTTNLLAEDFRNRYGGEKGRIADRIRERGRFVSLATPSMRGADVP